MAGTRHADAPVQCLRVPRHGPILSDQALEQTLDEWAPPWIMGFHAARTFFATGSKQMPALFYHANAGSHLGREAPTHFTVPSGSHIPIGLLGRGKSDRYRCGCRNYFGFTRRLRPLPQGQAAAAA